MTGLPGSTASANLPTELACNMFGSVPSQPHNHPLICYVCMVVNAMHAYQQQAVLSGSSVVMGFCSICIYKLMLTCRMCGRAEQVNERRYLMQ
jgi:hypothetical protein